MVYRQMSIIEGPIEKKEWYIVRQTIPYRKMTWY
jgi:hypothetical protein